MNIWMRKKGFTLVEIMIVVAIIGLLAAIAIPNFANARTTAIKNACRANLRQITGAMVAYNVDEGKNATGFTDLTPDYLKANAICGSGTYSFANGEVTCSQSDNGHNLSY
jgi:prepilin-type N-terminal cleavage/methylation domain-containing protein